MEPIKETHSSESDEDSTDGITEGTTEADGDQTWRTLSGESSVTRTRPSSFKFQENERKHLTN